MTDELPAQTTAVQVRLPIGGRQDGSHPLMTGPRRRAEARRLGPRSPIPTGLMLATARSIVLCAGKTPARVLGGPAGTGAAMVPINGKPAIGWILDDLLSKGICQATVVVDENDRPLQDFLGRAFARRMNLGVARIEQSPSILHSLRAGLGNEATEAPVRIILGDTLIEDRFDHDGDFAYVGEVDDSRRWCVAMLNGRGEILDYLDKQDLPYGAKHALAGYYQFRDGPFLRSCLEGSLAAGGQELSDVLRRYGQQYPIRARSLRSWFDFGHPDKVVEARRGLIKPRYFNSLQINPILNTITKLSRNTEKLADELAWYQELPEELKVLTPRILSRPGERGLVQITQEYYGYPTLAELYVYASLDLDAWASILRHVLRIHAELRKYPGKVDEANSAAMYLTKPRKRLEELRAQDPRWDGVLDCEAITLNGKTLSGLPSLEETLRARAAALGTSSPASIIHGDYCFSNILFDVDSRIVRLIDPRGRFGTQRGIHGDPRYDAAKLRHSVSGLYDYIIADMFTVEEEGPNYQVQIYANGAHEPLVRLFDDMLEGLGYDLAEIRLIEGLLFLSMLPLHRDHPRRQIVMFLTAIRLLNEVLT